MAHPIPRDDGSAAYADWRRRMQDLADSIDAAADEADRDGPVPQEEVARVLRELEREFHDMERGRR
ncbi:MAG: hypothetical protein LDL26_06850 [Caenispirillum bisanense]|nr:hypothetical protein [Caenispirillum bisanense]MCA1973217.1 hypothetical protein [Caenispirillum sp.]